MTIAKGQYWKLNTFDMGFINILPFDLLVHVDEVDYKQNLLILSPKFPTAGYKSPDQVRIEHWFRTSYPTIEPRVSALKQPAQFELLVQAHGRRVENPLNVIS